MKKKLSSVEYILLAAALVMIFLAGYALLFMTLYPGQDNFAMRILSNIQL